MLIPIVFIVALNLNTLNCAEYSKNETFQWGTLFDLPLHSSLIDQSCQFQGFKLCCSSLIEHNNYNKQNLSPDDWDNHYKLEKCEVTREYFSSAYETAHYEKALEIDGIGDAKKRRRMLWDFLMSPEQLQAATRWLISVRRLTKDMTKPNGTESTSLHFQNDSFENYLSYFNVTKRCTDKHGGVSNYSWIEWIEPLTMHARHPFAFLGVMSSFRFQYKPGNLEGLYQDEINLASDSSLGSTDHVLLQPSSSQTKNHLSHDNHNNNNHNHNHHKEERIPKRKENIRKYMFDAGTSRFDSSLWWFTCAYSQIHTDFDQLFGWEVTLLEPREFWSKVPPRYKNNYHYYNIPISADISSTVNPLHIMKEMGLKKDDFVAFKLDIDTPEVEIPIALELLYNPEFSELVDEFFFELHFQCDYMVKYWGPSPPEFMGLPLNRSSALKFFTDLRRVGVRSHFWP